MPLVYRDVDVYLSAQTRYCMIRIGIMGYGYWGPNVVRNFLSLPEVRIKTICDTRPSALTPLASLYPSIQLTSDPHVVMDNQEIDAVVIVTPIRTHFTLAKDALLHGKHVFIEKPMTATSAEANNLCALAKKKKRILMVDHTFLYTPAIEKMKEIVTKGELGKLLYIDCVRTNLGLLQSDSNVIYDLATHDFSIIDLLLKGKMPITIQATGIKHKRVGQESVAYITAHYPGDLFVHATLSWMSPMKVRTITIVGTKKMLLYDDMETSEKIKIFDKGVSIATATDKHKLRIGYRVGPIVSPNLEVREGLAGATRAFIDAIHGKSIPSSGEAGKRIVKILEKATLSLKKNGAIVKL